MAGAQRADQRADVERACFVTHQRRSEARSAATGDLRLLRVDDPRGEGGSTPFVARDLVCRVPPTDPEPSTDTLLLVIRTLTTQLRLLNAPGTQRPCKWTSGQSSSSPSCFSTSVGP